MTARKLPMQPVVVDRQGEARFIANKVVLHLLDQSGLSLADVLSGDHPADDVSQFHQLLGFSVDDFCSLKGLDASTRQAAHQAADAARNSMQVRLHWQRVEVGWYRCLYNGQLFELRLRHEPCMGTYRLGGRDACKLPWLCHNDPATGVQGLCWVAHRDGRPLDLPDGGSIAGVVRSLIDGKARIRLWILADGSFE